MLTTKQIENVGSRPWDRLKSGDTDFVTFEVSEDKVKFYLHRDIVCKESKVFAAAFKPRSDGSIGFKETQEQAMTLPEENLCVFKLFTKWLYASEFKHVALLPTSIMDDVYYNLASLYDFADRYDIPTLLHQCRSYLYDALQHHDVPTLEGVEDVFDSTEPGSIIRQLFVDAIVYKAPITWMYDRYVWKTLRDWPEVFLDIARCSTQRANGRRNPFEKGYKETYFVQAHEYLKALKEDPLDPEYFVSESTAPLTAFCQPDSKPVIERTASDSYVLEFLPPCLEPGVRP